MLDIIYSQSHTGAFTHGGMKHNFLSLPFQDGKIAILGWEANLSFYGGGRKLFGRIYIGTVP